MPLAISTNIAAEKANYYLGYNADKVQESIKRLASGKRLTSPVQDPGNLAVSMKLSASLNRLSGAMNNAQNGISFLEVQDGMLETAGKILDRMSELKGLASQDPMKSEMDSFSYNNEFKDLQVQLHDISQMKFNGVSIFANHTTDENGNLEDRQILFNAQNTTQSNDNTLTIFTSADGAAGSKVSLYKSSLLSALTLRQDRSLAGSSDVATASWGAVNGSWVTNSPPLEPDDNEWVTFAASEIGKTLDLDMISVGVISQALENISYLRAQNGGTHSRLAFNAESLVAQKTNMRAALGRMVDVDMAEESTNLAKYSFLSQAAASVLSQANTNTDIALMLLR